MMKKMKLTVYSTMLTLLASVANAQSTSNTEPDTKNEKGFVSIFNGKNFDGWYLKVKNNDGALAKKVFTAKDGIVHVFNDAFPEEIDLDKGTDDSIGMMYTKKEYSKYHLKFQYKWGTKKANYFKKWQYDAGVYYHITDDKIFPTGIEYQIHYHHLKNENHTGDLIRPKGVNYDWYHDEKTKTYLHPDQGGKLMTNKKKWLHHAKPTNNYQALDGKWNTCEIIVMGNEYAIHKLNGEIVNMCFKPNPGKGIIGFQSETAEIFYRNIQIKEFKESIPSEKFLTSQSQPKK